MTEAGRINVGIGGWTYAPWRRHFYPAGLTQKRELEYASRQVSAIEINGTYYRTQSAASFAKWRDETPPGFVFSMKALRYTTLGRVLADAGESIQRFVDSGPLALGDKLGPMVWQFAPSKRFEPADFEAFLEQLPASNGGVPLRHAVEVRHDSFMTPGFLALARHHGVATVFTDSEEHPSFADVTGAFVYARLMRSRPEVETGYSVAELERWAERARLWAQGNEPADLPRIESSASAKGKGKPRDVFIYFINGAKENAPAAAMKLIEILKA